MKDGLSKPVCVLLVRWLEREKKDLDKMICDRARSKKGVV